MYKISVGNNEEITMDNQIKQELRFFVYLAKFN
jgi:hypothetical protein